MKKNVAAAILRNDREHFLMHLRDDKPTIVYPNYWSFLGGGVESGESTEQALRREIKEEIDYKLRDVFYLGVFDDLFGSLVYVYKSRIDKGLSELTLTEGQKLSFFPFDEILKLKIAEPLKEFLIKNKDKIINE